MRILAAIGRPGIGDRAVMAAVMAALVVLAAVPSVSDAEGRRPPPALACTAR